MPICFSVEQNGLLIEAGREGVLHVANFSAVANSVPYGLSDLQVTGQKTTIRLRMTKSLKCEISPQMGGDTMLCYSGFFFCCVFFLGFFLCCFFFFNLEDGISAELQSPGQKSLQMKESNSRNYSPVF